MASSKKAPKNKAAKSPVTTPAKGKPAKAKATTKAKAIPEARSKIKARSSPGKRSITAAQRAGLLALDPAFDAPIDRNIAETQQEARELESVLAKLGKEIYAKSNLVKAVGSSLEARRALLDLTEAAWTDHRNVALSKSLRLVRADAEALKRDAIAALRHFTEHDTSVQARVDAIVLGTGLPDLIDDLKKLALLLDEAEPRLVRADLPKHPSDIARGFAESLSRGSADRIIDPVGASLMSLRNRAFWSLRDAMDAVRSAGRYVYRKQPKLVVAFRASSSRARDRAMAARAPESAVPGPPTTNGSPLTP